MPIIAQTQAQISNIINSQKNISLLVIILICVLFSLAVLLVSFRFYSKRLINPISALTGIADKLAIGDIRVDIKKSSNDEIGTLMRSFGKMIENIKKQVLVAEKIASGDMNTSIDAQSEDDVLSISLSSVISTLKSLAAESDMLSSAADKGDFTKRGDAGRFNGHFASIILSQNHLLDEVVKAFDEVKRISGEVEKASELSKEQSLYLKTQVKRLAENLEKLSRGDLNLDLTLSEGTENTAEAREMFSGINGNLVQVKTALKNLIEDTQMLSAQAIEGNLDAKADASRHNGEYLKIVEGINSTLDAIVTPINNAELVLRKISVNDLSFEISGSYKGKFKELFDGFEKVKTSLLSIEDAFTRAAVGDTARLEEFKSIGKRSETDKLVPAIISMMQAISDLTKEADALANAAVEGDLAVRGDEAKFEGGYRKIISGMNRTMEAVYAPIAESSKVLQRLSEGDLTVFMSGEYKGEYNLIKDSMNNTIMAFNDLLSAISSTASEVASGSQQVSAGSQALSQGATEQASSVEELTSTIAEIAQHTKQNAIDASRASSIAETAQTDAASGNEEMKKMLDSMSSINESSSNISKIIKVIDDIAFQTNILALNAAVEAARAGQYGKGFAVVAEEVRNLAAKSAEAAKNTTDLIANSMTNVHTGMDIANGTAQMLNKIQDSIHDAASLFANIAVASNEQANSIAQIDQGIMQVSKVVQTNSATAEESAASSEELSSQADLLKQYVGKFKLNSSHTDYVNKITAYEQPNTEIILENKPTSRKRNIALEDNYGKY